MEEEENIVIIGGGLAGLATALGLHRLGLRSLVLESSHSLRVSGFTILLWTNAWKALDCLGVGDELRKNHYRLQQLIFCSANSGNITSKLPLKVQCKSGPEHEARSIRRNQLLEVLAKELPKDTIRFSCKVVSIEEAGELKLLRLSDGSIIKTKVLIGCDGINSIVAKWLGLEKAIHSGRSAARGLTTFPNGHGFKPEIRFFFGKAYRSGLIPYDEKSAYWFLTWSSTPDDQKLENDPIAVKEFVKGKIKSAKVPEELKRAIEQSELDTVAYNSLRHRSPFDLLFKDISRGNVCLAGDALHPMTPDMGQGGSSALEDSIILAKCLCKAFSRKGNEIVSVENALKMYAENRRRRSIELMASSYILGFVQESSNPVMNFFRDEWLSNLMCRIVLNEADFNCGNLWNN